MPIKDLLGDIEGFVDKVFDILDKEGIDVSESYLDHICYRVETQEEYKEFQTELEKYGYLLTEKEINGRPISSYKLIEPIVLHENEISVVELPSPKADTPYKRGLEHAELVIVEDFKTFMGLYPSTKFNMKAANKAVNPDVSIKYDGITIKFHHKPLEYVILHEQ